MSTANHNSSKKSSNSSVVNTPASTPVTNINGNPQSNAQNSPPPNNNAPKYGTLVPNRIFVGGISANTTEGELMQLFSSYGTVKAAKIIQDRAGVSKGYGFITFESEDDAKRPLRDSDNIVLRERKLNIAPAIKKQPFSRAFDASSPPAVAAGNPAQFFFPPGAAVPYFQGGVAYYPQPTSGAPGDPNTQQPVYQPAPPVYQTQSGPPQAATYPSMIPFPQTIYMPQQYPMPMPYDYNYYQGAGAMPAGPGGYMVSSGGNGSGQTGGGGQCGPSGVSHAPNSPPRPPPCYGQQLPPPGAYGSAADAAAAAAAAAAVFYNMPMYGHPAAMDGTGGPVYADSFDMGGPSGGTYTEDTTYTPSLLDQHAQQDIDLSQHTSTATTQVIYETASQPPPLPQASVIASATSSSSITSTNAVMGKPPSSIVPENNTTNEITRNSATPVVSLLSIDKQQEKDYDSMQGGRRRKSQPHPAVVAPVQPQQMPAPQQHNYPPNGYVSYPQPNPFLHHHHPPAHHPPGHIYPFNGHFNGPQMPIIPSEVYRYGNNNNNNNNVKTMSNGIVNRKRRPAYGYSDTKRSNDHSSRSSLRTDSNSSASCVDENKNEQEKGYRTTNVTSPPPAPYSPMANYHYQRVVTNANRNPRGSSHSYTSYSRSVERRNYSYNNNNNNNNSNFSGSATYHGHAKESDAYSGNQRTHHGSSNTMHGSGQNFNPPARRSRRSIRRGTSGTGNEIGAGDAPLPMEDVAKKMESLKM